MTARNEQGLTPPQILYLKHLAECLDPLEAARNADISWRRVKDWIRAKGAFRLAFDELTSGYLEVFRRESQTFADAAQEEAWELLKAMKPVPVKCPGCGEPFSIEVRDTSARIKMVEIALKLAGRLKDIRRHELEGEVVHLTASEKLALTALRMGKEISAQVYEGLLNRNLIPEELKRPQDQSVIVEGEAKEVPNGSTTPPEL